MAINENEQGSGRSANPAADHRFRGVNSEATRRRERDIADRACCRVQQIGAAATQGWSELVPAEVVLTSGSTMVTMLPLLRI